MNSYVLQAEDVAIHYGGVKALDGVGITLEKGQIRGLIGPNGAGKSTVIDAITGRRKLTRGTVLLDGEDVSHMGYIVEKGAIRFEGTMAALMADEAVRQAYLTV